MIKFGSWVDFFVRNYLGLKVPVLIIYNLGEWFSPKFDTLDIIELAIAIFLMIFKGWQISREKHLFLDKYFLKFYIDNKKITQLKTSEIETALIINQPQLSLLVLDSQQWLQITDLQQKKDFKTMLLKLEEGLSLIDN